MSRGMSRAERLREMERLYVDKAFTDIEMAQRLGVDRITVYKDRAMLESEVPFIEVERGRWKIDRTKYLSAIRLSLSEALALYLPARRAARQTLIAQPHVANALEKLAVALKQPMTERLVQAANVILTQSAMPERVKVMETVTRAWVERLKMRIAYRGLHARQVGHHLVSPYLIEPSLWSDGAYIVGHSDYFDDIAVFKIERIEQATLTTDSFEIPEHFDEQELLRYAWGIWRGEGEPERVVLRFAPGEATRRIKESIWHPQQEPLVDTPDGGCIWAARVSEPREMLPWIRGWGADCEVLEPEELRDALAREARELAELYQVMEVKARQLVYYAHTKDGKDESEWQKLIDHLTRVGDYAAEFGHDAGVSELAKIAGLIHDLGKYSKEFQARLRGSRVKADHATAGAKELTQLFKGTPQEPLAILLAYCISGHHTGLLDYGDSSDLPGDGTLQARLKTSICDYSAYKTELDFATLEFPRHLQIRPLKSQMGFSFGFLTRMIYSALVDADFQDTEEFVKGKKPRGEHENIETLRDKLNEYLRQFDNPQTDINRKRTETLQACLNKANEEPGFFKLTVPTGGGKTLASMAFALNHAAAHGLKRIIYVIPFTTIIEQNAGVFKEILGEENVLEHHSNFDWEERKHQAIESAEDQTRSVYAKLKLAAENWDIPIVVTTNVQFFESLFANKYSRCRKLHNLAKSVIVFDEAQMFPRDYMLPAMSAVWELVTNYGASAVFCTATQPKLEKFLPEKTEIKELAPDPAALFDFYKRVEIENAGKLTDDELVARLSQHAQVLCIVNTRRHASGLFQKLEGEGNYHLSTLMCPTHRKQKLAEIRERLDKGMTCRVISTSVMEAGIDVDFPVGYRALTGLDSINQAAGRVNRNMKRTASQMFIFEPDSEFIKRTPRYVAQGVEVTRGVLRDYESAPISIPAIDAYFERLYSLKEPRDFDIHDVIGSFRIDVKNQPIFNFARVAENFHVIEDVTKTVIIPFNEEAKRLVEELKFTPYPSSTLRKLQPYTVSIFEGEFDALSSKGVIETIADAYAVLSDVKNYYDEQTGLLVPTSGGGDGLFF